MELSVVGEIDGLLAMIMEMACPSHGCHTYFLPFVLIRSHGISSGLYLALRSLWLIGQCTLSSSARCSGLAYTHLVRLRITIPIIIIKGHQLMKETPSLSGYRRNGQQPTLLLSSSSQLQQLRSYLLFRRASSVPLCLPSFIHLPLVHLASGPCMWGCQATLVSSWAL